MTILLFYFFAVLLILFLWHRFISRQAWLKQGILCHACDMPLREISDTPGCAHCKTLDVAKMKQEINRALALITRETLTSDQKVIIVPSAVLSEDQESA